MRLLRRHKVLVGLAVGVVVLAGVAAWLVTDADSPGPASMEDALDRFQHDGGDDATAGELGPPAGVYQYEGEGGEHLSFPPLDQEDGAMMPGTVTPQADGCWRFRLDFNAEHWQDWAYCPAEDGEGFAEVGGRSGQRWDLGVTEVGNVSSFACDPANPIVGPAAEVEEVEHRCVGTNTAVDGETTSEGSWTIVGRERLDIGGEAVEVVHGHGERTLTGGQRGTEVTDAWFRADGLLIRYERDIEVRTSSPVGDITYTESGWFELTDLEPQR